MKTLYIDCGMGAAGDMLAAALLELLPEPEAFIREMNRLGIPGVTVAAEKSVKCGITGTHFSVKVGEREEGESVHGYPHSGGHTGEHSHDPENDGQPDHDHEGMSSGQHYHNHDYHHEPQQQGYPHQHSDLQHIRQIIDSLSIPETVKADILAVYQLIAQAESHVHGVPVSEIHFHEVGTMDAIADITAVCLLMHELKPDRVVASSVHVGSGTVRCAHGILPVPAPATAYLLRKVPVYGSSIRGELCTPTGAALLTHFVTEFGALPAMKVETIGYGMGKKDFERANCVRTMLGETVDRTKAASEAEMTDRTEVTGGAEVADRTEVTGKEATADQAETITELNCNVDDMTGETIGFAMEQLLKQGALEVYTVPVGMKKSRPGIKLCVLCREKDREHLVGQIFKHTTTLGIRETVCRRYTLDRSIETVETVFGEIRRKTSRGYGVERSKYEYEDLARIAREQGLSIAQVLDRI